MLRLFAGIEVPEQHRLRLDLVRSPLPGAKWVDPADMHITLRFAGDIDNRVAEDFAGFLADIDLPPFDVVIAEVGAFGGREPRVIYAGVEANPALESLYRAVERAARSAGLELEARGFKPHVTLARLKGTRAEVVARFLGSRAVLKLAPFTVAQFVLFSARPNVGGGPYVVEEVFGLGG